MVAIRLSSASIGGPEAERMTVQRPGSVALAGAAAASALAGPEYGSRYSQGASSGPDPSLA